MQAVKRGFLSRCYTMASPALSPHGPCDENGIGLHTRKLGGPDQAVGGTGERRADQQHVGRLKEVSVRYTTGAVPARASTMIALRFALRSAWLRPRTPERRDTARRDLRLIIPSAAPQRSPMWKPHGFYGGVQLP
jgi:hypothetical protein